MDATTTPIPSTAGNLAGEAETLTPILRTGTVPTRALSGGRMHLPSATTLAPQRHDATESAIAIISGHVAVLSGNAMQPFHPQAGDIVYIPATLPYAVVNLSNNASVLALVFRTDPGFDTDVHRIPELDHAVRDQIPDLRRAHHEALLTRRSGRARRT
ncbi:putative RmlC-like cupin family protein [Amycolatopsis lexingtonensis]|uniref:RmlC-like cupin family protein n=1 Tax=Amycolatopsis lexingtonensis TaxID=218822 RepID=A0ABR9HQE4_9PSEU|nr:cupin domain-containing protein [Amycolatopsis lexingtonensis]MBE1493158.1 putative RmlC-like cupin family protein [Amycolatopsis lexingtonensis]